ncbi:MAG: amidohydrolase [Myxococcota bacterium]|nr:amidohydrolase [Myxococcota bacterium]
MRLRRRDFVRGTAGAFAALPLAGLPLPGCSSRSGEDATVFRGGVVLPVDAGFSEHSALLIRGNLVERVGSDEEVLAAAGAGARVVDLDGRTVLPGFIEPHMHFLLLAGLGHLEDIGAFERPTFEDTLAALREIRDAAAATGPDAWVMGRQFDPIQLEPPRDLTTRELDELAPDRPVFVLNASGHIAYVNSRALDLAGITRDSPDPPGGEYGRYPDGSPNGVLYGSSAHMPVLANNPEIEARLQGEFVEAGIGVGEAASALGITTLCDQATGAIGGPAELARYREMYAEGRMKTRLRAYLYEFDGPLWKDAGVRPGDGDPLLRVSGLKLVTDGSNQGFTGRQREPYHTRDTLGLYYIEPDALREMVQRHGAQGWPLSLHGNGDAAIDSILDALEHARDQGVDVKALRCRIEHCSILHDEQIARIVELGMGPSFLINHVHYWGHVMRDLVFGPEKVELLDRCASVERAGAEWSMHTDAPISPLGSLHKIRVAVARDLWKEPETVLAPSERVSVEAAIRSITTNAAWQCHSEQEIGSLEPGKLADLVVLESDPRKVSPTAISDIRVSETWMDGRQVFGG